MSGFMSGSRIGMLRSLASKSFSSRHRKRPQQTRQSSAWGCESLETRRLFATVTWITNGSGDWSVGANWNTGTPPNPGDDVVINVPGLNVVVTYAAAPVLPLNNVVCDETLVLGGAGGATWTSGTFDGSGIIDSTTTLSISGPADKILKDGIRLTNDGAVTVTGSGNIVGQVGATIANNGMWDCQSDMAITFPTGIGDGNFNNTGTFLKSMGGTAPGDMTEIGGPQGFTFNNNGDCQILQGTLGLGDNTNASSSNGTFEISAGATLQYLRGVENIVTGGSSITGMGTLLDTGGTVQHFGIFNVDTVDMESGSFLLQQNGNPQNNTNINNCTPAGDVNNLLLNGGTFGGNGGGVFNVGNQSAPFNAPANPPTPAGAVVTSDMLPIFGLNPGTYELPAIIVNTTFNWTGGTISGTGRMVIDTAVVNNPEITTTNTKTIAGGFGLDVLNELEWTGSGTIGITGGSAIWIHPSGTFWDQNDGTISGQGGIGNIINAGNFLKENGVGTTLIDTGISFFNNVRSGGLGGISQILYPLAGATLEAQLDIQTGTVAFNGNSTNTDTYTISPGTALSFLGGTHINGTNNNLNNPAKILGTNFQGTINFGNCVFTGDARARLDVGTTNFGTGTYDFNNLAGGAQVVHVGTFNGGATGSIGGNGTLEIMNSFAWSSGTFTGTGSGTSSLLIDSSAVVTLAAGDYTTTNNYSVDDRGTLQWATSPGNLSVGGNFDETATGTFVSTFVGGVPDTLTVSGTVTLAGTLNLSVTSLVPVNGTTYTLIDNTGGMPISGQFIGIPEGIILHINGFNFGASYVGGGAGDSFVLTSIVFPTITILPSPVFVRALSGESNMVFVVQLSAVTTVPVTVHYTTTPGSAVPGTDYITTTGTLTLPAGTQQATISVPIIGTSAVTTAKTFTVTISNPTSAMLGMPSSVLATIVSVNGPPVLQFQASAYLVDENAGVVTIVVTSSNPALSASVHYATMDGSALAGTDYVATSGVLTFTAGTSQLSFNVPIIDQGITNQQKVFSVNLSNPAGNGALLGLATAGIAILDNDGVTPSVSIAGTTLTEPLLGQANAVFALTLSSSTPKTVTVQYATASGTALEGKYVAATGTVTFAPGQTTASIDIGVNSDFVQTTTETFTVTLSNPVNVTLGTATATATILSQTLTTVPFSAGHPFHYLDAFNQHATISLSGSGSGILYYLGSTQQDAKEIVLSGTTSQSTLSIGTSRGNAGIENIFVNGSIRAINAAPVLLTGVLNVTGGIQTLRMNTLSSGSAVTIGSGAGIALLNATFNSIVNSSFSSAIPLGNLHVNSWQNGIGVDGISAPSAKAISAARDFSANVSIPGNLGSMAVRGNLSNSVIRVGGSINIVTAGTISNSDIFAGVVGTVSTLPATTNQFANSASAINHLTVTRRTVGAFANSLIAAPTIGSVQLARVTLANGGTPFGVAGASIRSVKGRATLPFNETEAVLLTSPFSSTDLQIHLTK